MSDPPNRKPENAFPRSLDPRTEKTADSKNRLGTSTAHWRSTERGRRRDRFGRSQKGFCLPNLSGKLHHPTKSRARWHTLGRLPTHKTLQVRKKACVLPPRTPSVVCISSATPYLGSALRCDLSCTIEEGMRSQIYIGSVQQKNRGLISISILWTFGKGEYHSWRKSTPLIVGTPRSDLDKSYTCDNQHISPKRNEKYPCMISCTVSHWNTRSTLRR